MKVRLFRSVGGSVPNEIASLEYVPEPGKSYSTINDPWHGRGAAAW
jgi:hypothetical protein